MRTLSLSLALTVALAAPAAAQPQRVIVDTDIHADVDDAAALTMLHNLQDRGRVNLLAVMVNTPGRWGAPCVDAINTWNGRSDIPIGALKPVDNSLHGRTTARPWRTSSPTTYRTALVPPAPHGSTGRC
jgi:membrane-bound ClpP family serine protease